MSPRTSSCVFIELSVDENSTTPVALVVELLSDCHVTWVSPGQKGNFTLSTAHLNVSINTRGIASGHIILTYEIIGIGGTGRSWRFYPYAIVAIVGFTIVLLQTVKRRGGK